MSDAKAKSAPRRKAQARERPARRGKQPAKVAQPKVAQAPRQRTAPKPKPQRPKPKPRPPPKIAGGKFNSDGSISLQCNIRVVDRTPRVSRHTGVGLKAVRAAIAANPSGVVAAQWDRVQQMAGVEAMNRRNESGTVNMSAPQSAGTGLSGCAALYAKALSNPFGDFKELPCTPCSPPVQSQRWRGSTRGTFQTGTGNIGYVMVAPYVSNYDGAKINYTVSPTYTQVGSAKPLAGVLGEVPAMDPTLPYTTAQLNGGISSRLVGCALRVRDYANSGNVGGLLFGYQCDDAVTLANNLTFNQIMALPQDGIAAALQGPMKLGETENEWTTLVYRPQDMESLDFSPDNGTPINNRYTMIIVALAPGVVQTYEWELVSFYEYTGISLVGATLTAPTSLQASHADSVGLDRVLEAAQRLPLSMSPAEWVSQMAVGSVGAMANSDSAARTVEDLMGTDGLPTATVGKLIGNLIGFLSL